MAWPNPEFSTRVGPRWFVGRGTGVWASGPLRALNSRQIAASATAPSYRNAAASRRTWTGPYGGGDIPIWWRTSAEVAHESSRCFPRASHSAALDPSLREAARCHSACRDIPVRHRSVWEVRSCDRATFTASFSIAEKYFRKGRNGSVLPRWDQHSDPGGGVPSCPRHSCSHCRTNNASCQGSLTTTMVVNTLVTSREMRPDPAKWSTSSTEFTSCLPSLQYR